MERRSRGKLTTGGEFTAPLQRAASIVRVSAPGPFHSWPLPRPTCLLHRRRPRKHPFFFPRPPDDLNPDRQPFRRASHRHHDRRKSQQVEPLAITPGIEILHRLPFHQTLALAVPERGDRRRRTDEHRIWPHLRHTPLPT